MILGRMTALALDRLAEVIGSLEWPDPKPLSLKDPSMIERQESVLRVIAQRPGSAIVWSETPRADERPIRLRTVERLVDMGELEILRADNAEGTLYIQLTAKGWDRITKKMDKV